MIPAATGIRAVFEIAGDEEHQLHRRVEAWGDRGIAMVVNEETGRLTPVSDMPSFLFLVQGSTMINFSAKVPKQRKPAIIAI